MKKHLISLLFILIFTTYSYASSLSTANVPSSSITKAVYVDDFSGSGNPCSVLVGASSGDYSTLNNPWAVRYETTAALNNFSIMGCTGLGILGAELFDLTFIVKTGYVTNTSMLIQFGISNNTFSPMVTPGIAAWIQYDSSANANWVAKGSYAGVVTSYTSSIPVTTNTYYWIRLVRSNTDLKFYVNNTLIGTYTEQLWLTDTINFMGVVGVVQTLTTANRAFIIDYFKLEMPNLIRY